MIKTKSIFSRAVSSILALLMILSTLAVGITATSAAEVQLAEVGAGTKTVYVGVISYITFVPTFHYWGGTTSPDGDAELTPLGGDNESFSVGTAYWSNEAQSFKIYSCEVPDDVTSGKTFRSSNNDRWANETYSIADGTICLLFEYGGSYHNVSREYTPPTTPSGPVFKAGDVVYLDVHNNANSGGSYWKAASAKMYVQFSTSTTKNFSTAVLMTEIAEGLYKYEFTSDCSTGIRFWRGNATTLWNYSKSLSSSGKNGIDIAGSGVSDGAGTERTFSDFALTKPTLTVSSTNFELGGSTTLESSEVKLGYNVTTSAGSASYQTSLIDAQYTFKRGSTNLYSGADRSYTWTPASAGTYSTTVTASSALSGVLPSTSTAQPVTVTSATPQYNVTVSAGVGGTVCDSASVPEGDEFELEAVALEGYTFSGWTITGTHTGGDTSSATTTITVMGDITATANFTANTSNISFVSGDTSKGTVSGAGGSITYPNTATSTATPIAGYKCTGWTITGGTAGVDYKITAGSTTGASITIQPIANGKTITATANFAIKTYTVTFVSNGTTVSTQTVNHGASAKKPTTNPSRENYTFMGWDKGYSNITADTTVNAKWAENVYVRGINGWTQDETYKMIPQDDGTYTLSVPSLTAGTYQYKIYNSATGAWYPEGGGDANLSLELTGDGSVSFTYDPNAEGDKVTAQPIFGTANISVTQNGAVGTVAVESSDKSGTVTAATGEVEVYLGVTSRVEVTAPDGYYIASIAVDGEAVYSNDDSSENTHAISLRNVTDDKSVVVTYAQRSAHTITILEYSTEQGVLKYNGSDALSGTQITVYDGDSVTITAVPISGCTVYYWIADSVIDGHGLTYTFENVTDDHNLDVEWKEISSFTVTVNAEPGGAGYVTGTYNGTEIMDHTPNDTITVTEYDSITIKETHAEEIQELYTFNGWSIDGTYTMVSGSIIDSEIVIEPTSNVVVTALYEKTHRYIYLVDELGWGDGHCYAHFYNAAGDLDGGWSKQPVMTYYKTNASGYRVYRIPVPLDATMIIFDKDRMNGSNQTESMVLRETNVYSNRTKTWSTYAIDGYYIFGKWNDKEYGINNLQRMISNGDGTYTLSLDVDKSYNGYIYINVADQDSHIWNASTNNKTDNPQILTDTGAFSAYDSRNKVRIRVNPTDPNGAYEVTVTFDSNTGEISWTVIEHVDTIQVNGYNGAKKNSSDDNTNDYVGNTYFLSSEDATVSTSQKIDHQEAMVKDGEPVNIYTQVNTSGTAGVYNYYVAGWVINGSDFVEATSRGNGLYSGIYSFSEELSIVVPVYFHTPEWRKAHNVEVVEVYAVTDERTEFWNDYMACYTWYKNSEGTTVYEQFGAWRGQLMIPVRGLEGVYYTYVETTAPDGTSVSGVTFNNSYYETGDDVQAYDYYEFMSLLNDGKSNITFVLKNANSSYNANRVTEDTNINLNNFNFIPFVDYNEKKTDIYGNDIEKTYDSLSDNDALYIVRAGDKKYTNDTLNGSWYVDCYFYNASGKYLGKCVSYEIKDPDAAIWTKISGYGGERVYVSYEAESNGRFDGQWYGDASVNTTVTPSVKVAFSDDSGASFTISQTLPINVDDYGVAYINGKYQKLDIVRGQMFTVSATAKAGYKFLGWFKSDGQLFTDSVSVELKAATGGTYIAVFEPLAEGTFYVNHYIYSGAGSSSYVPPAHNGHAQLYVGVTNKTTGEVSNLSKRNTASIAATEGHVLTITIGTNAAGADKFYAWYVDARDKYGLSTFEEVGVDSDDNMYDNNGTVVGRNDMIYFQFDYTVGTDFSLNLYSDIVHISVDTKLIYKYENRYGDEKFYYVPYTLTTQEVEGFEGNEYKPYTPAYISGAGWVNTVLANAPFVDDYYKDAVWTISETKYDSVGFVLTATQKTKTFSVSLEANANIVVVDVPFNEIYTVDVMTVDPNNTSRGFWINDVNGNGEYDAGDIIIGNTKQIAYRVTQDLKLIFIPQSEMDFEISIEAPVYGREQITDTKGNIKSDLVYIDYLTNILVPYYPNGTNPYGSAEDGTDVFAKNYYNGKPITEGLQHTAVTVETLKRYGFDVSYGLILEQVGSYKVTENGNYTTYEAAEAKAKTVGYGTATDKDALKNIVANNSTGMQGGKYYQFIDGTKESLTNKNRALITIYMNNTENNRAKFYNVYAYLKVTAPDGVTTCYVSDIQTLNIYNTGTRAAEIK